MAGQARGCARRVAARRSWLTYGQARARASAGTRCLNCPAPARPNGEHAENNAMHGPASTTQSIPPHCPPTRTQAPVAPPCRHPAPPRHPHPPFGRVLSCADLVQGALSGKQGGLRRAAAAVPSSMHRPSVVSQHRNDRARALHNGRQGRLHQRYTVHIHKKCCKRLVPSPASHGHMPTVPSSTHGQHAHPHASTHMPAHTLMRPCMHVHTTHDAALTSCFRRHRHAPAAPAIMAAAAAANAVTSKP